MSPVFNLFNESFYYKYYTSFGGILNGGIPQSSIAWQSPEQVFYNSLSGYGCLNGSFSPTGAGTNTPSYDFIYGYGSSVVPLGSSASGQAVGYSQVSVSETNLGKTVSIYKNKADEQVGIFLPNLKERSHTDNGQLSNEFIYDAQGQLVKEKEITYTSGFNYKNTGFRMMPVSSSPSTNVGLHITPAEYSKTVFNRFYEEEIDWWYPSQVVEKIYPGNGGTPLETVQNFFYDNSIHKQLTRTETTTSDGRTLIQKNYYPDDVAETGSLGEPSLSTADIDIIDKLKRGNFHIIGTPVQTEKIIKDNTGVNKLLTTQRTLYKDWGSDYGLTNSSLILPYTVQAMNGTYSGSNPLENYINFNKYSINGDLLEVSKNNDYPTCYLYGYMSRYPVAKITGAGYESVRDYVDMSVLTNGTQTQIDEQLSNLRTALTANNQVFITTYTYKPLVGITSETDPNGNTTYYEYDPLGRLIIIRDKDNNIIKRFSYDYASYATLPPETGDENCTFSTNPGYYSPTSGTSSNGFVVSGYFVFINQTTVMQPGISYQVATISEGCRPSVTRTFTSTIGGRNWVIAINPSGQVSCRFDTGGADVPVNTTIAFSSFTYAL